MYFIIKIFFFIFILLLFAKKLVLSISVGYELKDYDLNETKLLAMLQNLEKPKMPTQGYAFLVDKGINFEQFKAANICSAVAAKICFTGMDTNKDGFVTNSEIENYFEREQERISKMDEKKFENDFKQADADGNGSVSRQEMHNYTLNNMQIVPDNTLDKYFDEMDKNGDGQLSEKEFSNFDDTWYTSNYPFKFTFVNN